MYLQTENEYEKKELVWDGNFDFVHRIYYLLIEKDKNYSKDYPYLDGIDMYDDTVFNSIQTQKLIEELKTLCDIHIDNEEDKERIDNLIEFLSGVSSGTFVRVVGD